jgi:FixJ family two-component response regulator
MAGMSGIEVAQAIRSADADVPLILLTGSIPGIPVEKARIPNLTLLQKPIGLRELQDAVAHAIAQRRKGPARAEGRRDEPTPGALDERAG